MHSIYKITNKINNKLYIGLTIQGVQTRFLHHLYEARSGIEFPLHRAIRKYGEENFIVETIFESEDCTEELLKDLEKHYIRLYASRNYANGYNLTDGGDGTLGRLHSDETKDKIRQKAIGRKPSEETKSRQRQSQIKRKNTPEWQEWYNKYVKGNKNFAKETSVIKDGIIYKFESVKEACIFIEISPVTFHRKFKHGKEYNGCRFIDNNKVSA